MRSTVLIPIVIEVARRAWAEFVKTKAAPVQLFDYTVRRIAI